MDNGLTGIKNGPTELYEEQDDLFEKEQYDEDVPLPLQNRRLVTQPYDLPVRSIVQQIDDKSLQAKPSFQRGYVWDDIRASRLIESLLVNIPIPVCYFAEEESGKFIVIDGHQRLHSIWRFINNHFALKKLQTLPEHNTKYFKDLTEKDQRLLLGRYIRCIVITQDSDPEIRFEVFERLNTGSVPVSDQEIRNAVLHGDFNELIKRLAQSDTWLNLMSKTKLDKRMRDEELILRFFAIAEKYKDYQPPLKTFLNEYMEGKTLVKSQGKTIKRISLSEDEKKYFNELFEQTMDKASVVFGNHAFRTFSSGQWERQINRSLFDVVTLVFSQLPKTKLENKKSEIEELLISLFKDDIFATATSGSKAHRVQFVTRVKMFSEAMATIGLDTGIHGEIK